MTHKILPISVLLAALLLLTGVSCTRQELPGGAVTISLASGLPQTRGEAEILDGTEIKFDPVTGAPDLILLIFNTDGSLRARYPDGTHTSFPTVPTANDITVRFAVGTDGNPIPAGSYSVYAMANTGGMWTLDSGTVEDISSQAGADARIFTALPTQPTDRMPLTAIGSLEVNLEGNGNASLSLLRPAAKVIVRFINNYGDDLTLAQNGTSPLVELKEMVSDRGYLFPHNPDIPAGVSASDMVFNFPAGGVVLPNNADGNTFYELSSLLYPGTGAYACSVSFSISKVGTDDVTPAREFEFPALPILNKRGEDITSVARNQCLVITVAISKGAMLSFSFDVGEWNKTTETVTFD